MVGGKLSAVLSTQEWLWECLLPCALPQAVSKCDLRTETGSNLNIVQAVKIMKSSQACFLALDIVCSTGHTVKMNL